MISQLQVINLRNLEQIKTILHGNNNIIFGDNGSGKTSLLESIYLLTTGHSFRSRETSNLISFTQDALSVKAKLTDGQILSVIKHKKNGTLAQINDIKCHNSSSLARFLPTQVIYADIFQILDTGPTIRRALLDWGLFHVKHEYHLLWKKYIKIVKHRNSLLKLQRPPREFVPWDQLLVQHAEWLHEYRDIYFQQWSEQFKKVLAQITDIACSINYFPGWDCAGETLTKQLQDSYHSDKIRGYTQIGSHHADVRIKINENLAKKTLSRGQQKIVLIALKIAQAMLLKQPCVLLFDDIAAELDKVHLRRIGSLLSSLPGQKIITTVEPTVVDVLGIAESWVYKMENGVITKLV